MLEIPVGLEVTDPVSGLVYRLDSVCAVGRADSVIYGDFIEHEHGTRGDFPVLALRYHSRATGISDSGLDVRFTSFDASGAVLATQDSAAGELERGDPATGEPNRFLAGYWPVLPGTVQVRLEVMLEPLGDSVATIHVDLTQGTANW